MNLITAVHSMATSACSESKVVRSFLRGFDWVHSSFLLSFLTSVRIAEIMVALIMSFNILSNAGNQASRLHNLAQHYIYRSGVCVRISSSLDLVSKSEGLSERKKGKCRFITERILGSCQYQQETVSRIRVRATGSEMGEVHVIQNFVPEAEQDDANPLFQPLELGPKPFHLSHRIVMAPLTRSRSYGGIPQPHAILYYSQRTTPGGFLIAEATGINPTCDGYPHTPSCYTDEHVAGWKPIVKAVHDKGGTFFLQLWHVGRVSHTTYQPNGSPAPSSTNKRIEKGEIMLADGSFQPYSQPKAIETHEVQNYVRDFEHAAKQAIAAGFDGVEVHGAHGYLLDQFMKDGVNDRTDQYGGSLENRCRFPIEVVDAMVTAIGRERVGIRLSPYADYGECHDSDPVALGTYMAEQMNKRGIAYMHFVEGRMKAAGEVENSQESVWPFRKAFTGTVLAAGGYNREEGIEALQSGKTDAIVFGRHFLANPDLPKRLKLNAPLNRYNRATYYTQDPVVGYTDYPFLDEGSPSP